MKRIRGAISDKMDISAYTTLSKDFDTVANIVTSRGDELALDRGTLVVNEGGFLKSPTRTVLNLVRGGYNRGAVIDYLEKLAEKTDAFVTKLEKVPNSLLQNETWEFAKKIKRASTCLEKLNFEYSSVRPCWYKGESSHQKLGTVYSQFFALGHILKEQCKQANPHRQSARKLIDFDTPVNLRRIQYRLPSYQTPQDTLKLAESAEKQRVPLWKQRVAGTVFIAAFLVASVPLFALTALKWLIWNPIELAFTGKIETQNPFVWLVLTGATWWNFNYSNKLIERAVETYADQLLATPHITDAHVDAFCKLAPQVKQINMGLIILDGTPNRIAPSKASAQLSMGNFCKIVEALGKSAKCRNIILPKNTDQNVAIREILKRNGFEQDSQFKNWFAR